MLDNSWFKKEKPFLGLVGMAGGAAPFGGGGKSYEATGGVVNDYTAPDGKVYRAHIFTGTADFTVATVGTSDVSYMLLGAGGGSG